MHKLILHQPETVYTPEERVHNKALFEKFMPGFMEYFLDARQAVGARIQGDVEIHISDEELEFVQANMDKTKELVEV